MNCLPIIAFVLISAGVTSSATVSVGTIKSLGGTDDFDVNGKAAKIPDVTNISPEPRSTTIIPPTVPTTISPSTSTTPNSTTTASTTTQSTTSVSTTITTKAPPKPTPQPTTTSTTTVSPVPQNTTVIPTTTPTTVKPVDPTTVAPEPHRRFDGPSFVGGIVLALGLVAIGFVAFKFYKARTESNYHTL